MESGSEYIQASGCLTEHKLGAGFTLVKDEDLGLNFSVRIRSLRSGNPLLSALLSRPISQSNEHGFSASTQLSAMCPRLQKMRLLGFRFVGCGNERLGTDSCNNLPQAPGPRGTAC